MDKIKELLEDRNNKIIAVAILVVLVLGIAILVGAMLKSNSGSSSTTANAGATGTAGMSPSGVPGPAGMTPTGTTGPAGMTTGASTGIPSSPSGMGPAGMTPAGMPTGAPTGMPTGVGPSDDDTSATPVVTASLKGKPQEAGRIDPFAPIGVAKASKTKTFGNAVKARMSREGVDWRIPDLLTAISFTDYKPGETKIGYVKSAADIKREKDKADAKKAEKEKKQKDEYNKYMYSKPTNVRLSSIMTGSKGKTASFEVMYNGRSDYQTLKVGDKLFWGMYNGSDKVEAELKSIQGNTAVLKVVDEDIEWTYNLTDGNSRSTGYGTGYGSGMGTYPGMGINPGMGPGTGMGIPGGYGSGMGTGMPTGVGGYGSGMGTGPGMGGIGMNPGMGGIGGMNPPMGGF